MPVDKIRKIVYVHIPKTGGTAIEEALGLKKLQDFEFWGTRQDVDASKQHYSYEEMIKVNPGISEWFTFVSIRNPWDRVLSGWSHHKKWKEEVGEFDDFINLMKLNVFDKKNYFWLDGYVTPQTYFLPKNRNFHILRFEKLQEDFTKMCEENIEFKGVDFFLPRLNGRFTATGVGRNYFEYYNSRQMSIVGELFREEINLFNYKFGDI